MIRRPRVVRAASRKEREGLVVARVDGVHEKNDEGDTQSGAHGQEERGAHTSAS